jgi:hypothetical protein
MREMQSTEEDLSGCNALCTFSHLFHEVKNNVKMTNDNIVTTSIRRSNTNMTSNVHCG